MKNKKDSSLLKHKKIEDFLCPKKQSFLRKETWERKMNKKGAEMTIGTIIIIVLALIVLVVLVVGFTGGWSNLWGKITAFFGGGTNVDTIARACELACTSGSNYDYCKDRTLKWDGADGKLISAKVSCKELGDGGNVTTEEKTPRSLPLPTVDLSCAAIATCPTGGG